MILKNGTLNKDNLYLVKENIFEYENSFPCLKLNVIERSKDSEPVKYYLNKKQKQKQ